MHSAKWFSVLLVPLALAGCMTMEGGQFNMLSTDQEIELGKQFATEVERKEKILENAQVQAYAAQIGDRLARVSTRQGVPYSFKVIDAPSTVNAFALPGGNMYIYTGLMRLCDNEAELASVMAHEMGHVAAQHHGEALTRQYGYDLIMGVILGQKPGQTAQIVSGLLGQTVESRYSREQEREADALGMEFLFRAGYPPDAMISFMNKMLAEEQKRGGNQWLPIFASHPPTEERLQLLQGMLEKYPAEMRSGGTLNAERYLTIKSLLPEPKPESAQPQ